MNRIIDNASASGAPTWLSGSARRIVLVSGSASVDPGGPAAVEAAEMLARHRPRTLFVNTVTGPAGPDGSLGAEDRPGLGDVVSGRCRVSEVALTPQGKSFIFVPAGRSRPGMSELRGHPAFRHLVDAAGRGGTLLLHVAETDLRSLLAESGEGAKPEFDGLVVLGEALIPRDVPADVRLLARVERSGPPVMVAGSESRLTGRLDRLVQDVRARGAGGVRGAFSGSRKRPRGSLGRRLDDIRKRGIPRGAGGVAVVWIVAVLAVWLVWQGLSGWPAFEGDFDPPVESSMAEPSPAERAGEEGGNGDAAPAGNEEAAALANGDAAPVIKDTPGLAPAESDIASGVPLPYSVLVASYVSYPDAATKRDQLAEAGILAFVAPTPIRGRLYYRVFAGALEDRVQASGLMDRLVEGEHKERERDWDMRPVRLAFALGDFSSEEEADDELDRLLSSGVPAYVLLVADTNGSVYRLYSGAFESEAAAALADSILSGAGQAATLVTRRGEPR